MIGHLRGTVTAIDIDTVLIDVGGVGYEAYGHSRLLSRLSVGDPVSFSIETIVREDLIRLYAFEDEGERRAFRVLQSVQGVGAKHALAILQVLPPSDLNDAIAAEDVTALSRANGVGKKIAQRIAVELQSKLGALALPQSGVALKKAAASSVAATHGGTSTTASSATADALSALANLGYDGVDARRAIKQAMDHSEAAGESVEALIKAALKQLAA
ncbi:MAG: Holliday junction branch migration protein RuvA [Pseudomonadota bacterium]